MAGNEELIAQAVERGKAFTEEVLASDELTSPEEISAQLDMTLEEVTAATTSHVLLALGPMERRRYPKWQAIHRRPIPKLQEIFLWLDEEMTVFLFLREPLPLLGNRSPIEAIAAGEIDHVVSIAESIRMGGYL